MTPGIVHIVELDLAAPGLDGELDACLDNDERERAARFVFARHRVRFVVAHGLLRRTLEHFLGRAPRYRFGEQGKPFLVGEELQFNLSHSADRALVALTLHRAVGVDLEHTAPEVEFNQLAARYFSTEEQSAVERLGSPEFYRLWTLKEALIKGLGHGLSFPVPVPPPGWTVRSIDGPAGYASAFAVHSEVSGVCRWLADAAGLRRVDGDGATAPAPPPATASTRSPFLRR